MKFNNRSILTVTLTGKSRRDLAFKTGFDGLLLVQSSPDAVYSVKNSHTAMPKKEACFEEASSVGSELIDAA